MAKVIIGNASAITVPRRDRDSIRRFYGHILGGKLVKEYTEKDIFRLEGEFFLLFRYGDVPDESKFLRSPRALWLQLKSDDVEEMSRRFSIPAPPGLICRRDCPSRSPIFIFRRPEDSASSCSPSTRTRHIPRRPELGKGKGGRRPQGKSDEQVGAEASREARYKQVTVQLGSTLDGKSYS